MTTTIKTFKIDMKEGQPAVWEFGGARDQMGSARIIAGPDGKPCRPVEVPSELPPCSKHALFLVGEGHLIIDAWWRVEQEDDDLVLIWRVLHTTRVSETEASVTAGLINQYADGAWLQTPCADFKAAIEAVAEKAMEENCARVCYADFSHETSQKASTRSRKKGMSSVSPRRKAAKKGVAVVTSEVAPVPIPIVEGAPVVSSCAVETPPVPVEAHPEPCAREEERPQMASVETVVAARELVPTEDLARLAKHFSRR